MSQTAQKCLKKCHQTNFSPVYGGNTFYNIKGKKEKSILKNCEKSLFMYIHTRRRVTVWPPPILLSVSALYITLRDGVTVLYNNIIYK